jgi:excisionase family DNA binding protein
MGRTQLITVDECAAELGVTIACIRRWVLERRIAVIKIGRLVKIPQTEVERIVTAGFRPVLRDSRAGRGGRR